MTGKRSPGEQVVARLESLGYVLDPWQRQSLLTLFAHRPDGAWVDLQWPAADGRVQYRAERRLRQQQLDEIARCFPWASRGEIVVRGSVIQIPPRPGRLRRLVRRVRGWWPR